MKHDVKFWWIQRITAVFLVPFFLYALFLLVSDFNQFGTLEFLNNHLFAFSVLFLVAILHGAMGMQVILEDYISHCFLRNFCIAAVYSISFLTAFAMLFIVILLLH